ncbi:MAG: stage III sporulation protein AA [Caldicoprobacterales bacterium]|jgi:stage III sporulation protein AA|nr:stage III sporulation protein AA [Clostridiales bacterium]
MLARDIKKEPNISWQQPILESLPQNIQEIIKRIPLSVRRDLEEIRIRENRPLMIYSQGKDYFVCKDGSINSHMEQAYIITKNDTRNILQLISDYSIYAFEEELRNGYLTLQGGHRVGIAGKIVLDKGSIRTMKHIRSFNIRISKEIIGAADKIIPYLISDKKLCHTLILSPPQMGKTTILRDIARKISDGFPGFTGVKVGIVDERSEIAGCWQGLPQRNVGVRTDVLDSCPKAAGIMMMIRSMSPNVIITDEIGRMEDVDAILESLNAGIKVITSAHASDLQDAKRRPFLLRLLNSHVFDRIAVLSNSRGIGTLEQVYEGKNHQPLLAHPIR